MFERLAPEQSDTLEGVPEPSENVLLVGHEATVDSLAAAYQTGKLPHALLFAGPRGVGKATAAFHLAHHLLTHPRAELAPDSLEEPVPGSPLSRRIALGAHPAILHLTRPFDEKSKKFRTVVSVDEVRRVSRFLSMTSHDGSYRIVIVDPADDMNANAANALLKNLEEPPSRTLFVLIAHTLGSMLPTIRSRCQVVRFAPLQAEDLLRVLDQIGISISAEPNAGAALIAQAGGSARRAILLANFGGEAIVTAVDRLAEARDLDMHDAYRVADAVSARDDEIRFNLMNEHALDRVAQAAADAARTGSSDRAAGLARAWERMRSAIDDTDAYNLDRRQHTLNMMLNLHESLRMWR